MSVLLRCRSAFDWQTLVIGGTAHLQLKLLATPAYAVAT
eukprot:SAG11_NODE_33046_length_279_cov_0.866667_2_plen_38_part_01